MAPGIADLRILLETLAIGLAFEVINANRDSALLFIGSADMHAVISALSSNSCAQYSERVFVWVPSAILPEHLAHRSGRSRATLLQPLSRLASAAPAMKVPRRCRHRCEFTDQAVNDALLGSTQSFAGGPLGNQA
jgi:hypothetical protein